MAEAGLRVLLSKERPGQFRIVSAGTSAATGYPATAYAQEAVKLWDGNLSEHSSQPLTRRLIEEADLIFGMTPQHVQEVLFLDPEAEDKTYLLKNFPDHNPDGEGVDDPIGQSLDKYNETFLEIAEYLGKHLPEIVKLIDEKQKDA